MSENSEGSVDDLRQKGNHEFQQGKLDNAIAFYTAAIQKAPAMLDRDAGTNACIVNLCNRSACYFQLEDYEDAMKDALQAWTTSEQSNLKAAYRLSKTYMAMKQPQKAIEVLQKAISKGKISQIQPREVNSLTDLLKQAQAQLAEPAALPETSIKGVGRPISIREFTKGKNMGVGNFSEIIVVTHKITEESFALKILEKKQATDLAKRQHPNVWNEIAMECRILMERLPPHPRIIQMYHSFKDYYNLYYLMDLHNVNSDLWSCMKYKGKMVGTHPSMTRRWLLQLIDALEHMHSRGIVHRDLKPENILLNAKNHVVVIDFGTAKDLVQTDLNGPEFVGTPDFMSPEAVTGFSGMPGDNRNKKNDFNGATHCADLWALGGLAYILHTGSCPFWSPSPYLTFLRIKRGLLPRNAWAIPDDEAWNFCRQLMQVKPLERLGATCYGVVDGKVEIKHGYDLLRRHPYFATSPGTDPQTAGSSAHDNLVVSDDTHVIPSLQDLCIRACAELVQKDSLDLDICDQHPPGDNSKHDMMRLSHRQRCLIWHVLDKCKVFKGGDETRVFQRFFERDVDFLKSKVRQSSRDFVGLTQMNDDEYKPQSQRGSQDPYATKEEPGPTKVVIMRNPWLVVSHDNAPTTEQEKAWLKGWKKCVTHINKQRPKLVVACAPQLPAKYWKVISRIRDSIPVVWNDGSSYYSFWLNGFLGVVLQKKGFQKDMNGLQMQWLRELMEQSRMAKPQTFCFCDCDPRELPTMVLKRLARGRVLCLYGVSNDDLDYEVSYEPNETVSGNGDEDDDVSVKSTESEEDKDDAWKMRVRASSKNGLDWLTVDEKEPWVTTFEAIETPSDKL